MAVEGGALSASSTRATLNIPSPTRRSNSGGSLHSPQQPLSVDEVQVQPLVERLRYAQEHLKVSVNPRNGSLHLRGLLQAQAAVDATRAAQQDLTHQLLSMLRQQRQQSGDETDRLKEAIALLEHRVKFVTREHERELQKQEEEAQRKAAMVKADIEEAHSKIRALERAAVEDQEAYQLSLESFRRHNEAMKQNFEAHIAVERAEARDAAEQVANSHAQRVAQMTAEASARLRAMRMEVREEVFVVPGF